MPAEALTVALTSIQDLHGYDHPWAGGAGKNKFNKGVGANDAYLKNDGTVTADNAFYISDYLPVDASNDYTLSGIAGNNAPSICLYDENKNFISGENYQNRTSVTIATGATGAYVRISVRKDAENIIQLEKGSTATSYAPYSNICPISGRTQTSVTTRNEDNTESHTATISFGQTVYGGQVDFKTGRVRVDRAIVDLGTLIWGKDTTTRTADGATIHAFYAGISACKKVDNTEIANMLCSVATAQTVQRVDYGGGSVVMDNICGGADNNSRIWLYSSAYNEMSIEQFKTAVTGQTICYELATPTELTLTPSQLQMLKGYNSVTGDGVITITAYTGSPYPVEITRKRKTKKKGGK